MRGAGPRPRGVGQSTEPEGSGNRGEDLLTGCGARGRRQTRTSTYLMDAENSGPGCGQSQRGHMMRGQKTQDREEREKGQVGPGVGGLGVTSAQVETGARFVSGC